MNKLKCLMVILMGVIVTFVTQQVYYAKISLVNQLYSDVIFTRLTVEVQQYTRQIEYGLKNGKSLDNFYNVQTILNDVMRCSSYVGSAYIVSGEYRLLYSSSEAESRGTLTIQGAGAFSGDDVYAVFGDDSREEFMLTVPIYGRERELCGFMVLAVDYAAVNNVLAEYNAENLLQSVIISAEICAFGIIALIHFCKKRKAFWRTSTLTVGITTALCVLADMLISSYKFQLSIESLVQQSVSKITMTLQNDLDTVIAKGGSQNKIYDLNSWLLENSTSIPFIDNLIYDKDYKISAIVSEAYLQEQSIQLLSRLALIFIICAAAAAALYFLAAVGDKKAPIKDKNKRKEESGLDIIKANEV